MQEAAESSHQPAVYKDFNTLFKYKNKQFCSSIHERRANCLLEQKERRHRSTDKNREQFDLFINAFEDNGFDEMECDDFQNKVKKFRFKLMKTDWFTDIPEDLEENWLVKCAPSGYRVMLVSRKKHTICYNESGRSVLKLRSIFCGGDGDNTNHGLTILDCIYNKDTKTIFILDCLCWNNMSMIDSEAELRFFWLKSKFTEDLILSQCKNFKFILIDCIPAQRSLIQDMMFGTLEIEANRYYYDGIVFYHKESHYFFGKTPLVGWLASYMLTELLHIDVSEEHLVKRPEEYKGAHDYIQNVKTIKSERRKFKDDSKGEMDIS